MTYCDILGAHKRNSVVRVPQRSPGAARESAPNRTLRQQSTTVPCYNRKARMARCFATLRLRDSHRLPSALIERESASPSATRSSADGTSRRKTISSRAWTNGNNRSKRRVVSQ